MSNVKADGTEVWYLDFTGCKSLYIDTLAKSLSKEHLILRKWDADTAGDYGILFIEGMEKYEQVVSFLHVQIRHKGYRIIVLNTAPERLDKSYLLKFLHYGTEYIYERSAFDNGPLFLCERIQRWKTIDHIIQSNVVKKMVAGQSTQMKKLLRSIVEVTLYSDAAVLIQGQRGTGKEMIARLVHELDRRRAQGNLVVVDCTTVRPELSGSEFFGHEKGAYTGADQSREGAFTLAHNGTLFLDEVGELPLEIQATLLRIIQEGAYKRLGSNIWKQTSFRLVSATNRNLEEAAENGVFRKDLYDRMAQWKCYMPSLNERKEDVVPLVLFFLKKRLGDELPEIDNAVYDYLKERSYPGNIRELQALVYRIAIRYTGKGPLTLGDIPDYERPGDFEPVSNWYEDPGFINAISNAIQAKYDIKRIEEIVRTTTTRIALNIAGKSKQVSELLGKSERWVQIQKAKQSEP